MLHHAAPVTQNHLPKTEGLMLQSATLLRKSTPGPTNSSDEHVSCTVRLPWKMHLCRSSSNVPRLPSFLEMRQPPYVLLTFSMVHNPLRLPGETTSERPKVVRTCSVFNRRFSEPTCRPSGATNHWNKNTVFRDFPTFSRTWIFFLLRLSRFLFSFFFLLSSFFFLFSFFFFLFLLSSFFFFFLFSSFFFLFSSFFFLFSFFFFLLSFSSFFFLLSFFFFLFSSFFFLLSFFFFLFSSFFFLLSFFFSSLLCSALLVSSRLFSSLRFASLLFSFLLFSSLLFSDSSHFCFSSVHMVGSLTSKLPSKFFQVVWSSSTS